MAVNAAKGTRQCLDAACIRQCDTRPSAGSIVLQHQSNYYMILLSQQTSSSPGSADRRVRVETLLRLPAILLSGSDAESTKQQLLCDLLGINSAATFSRMATKGIWLAAALEAGLKLAGIEPLNRLYSYLCNKMHGNTQSPEVLELVLQEINSLCTAAPASAL